MAPKVGVIGLPQFGVASLVEVLKGHASAWPLELG